MLVQLTSLVNSRNSESYFDFSVSADVLTRNIKGDVAFLSFRDYIFADALSVDKYLHADFILFIQQIRLIIELNGK